MNLDALYSYGIPAAFVMAMVWSFVLDKKKPPTAKEFVAKLLARTLVFVVFLAVIVGFLFLATVDLSAS